MVLFGFTCRLFELTTVDKREVGELESGIELFSVLRCDVMVTITRLIVVVLVARRTTGNVAVADAVGGRDWEQGHWTWLIDLEQVVDVMLFDLYQSGYLQRGT